MTRRSVIINDWHAAAWVVFVACSSSGCGSSERATVTGRILRHDGAPLVGANVVATSVETGKSAHASTDQEGDFEFGTAEAGDGIPPGNYAVVIIEDRGDPDHRRRPTIAAKYRDPSKSGISLTVKAGEAVELNRKLDPP